MAVKRDIFNDRSALQLFRTHNIIIITIYTVHSAYAIIHNGEYIIHCIDAHSLSPKRLQQVRVRRTFVRDDLAT